MARRTWLHRQERSTPHFERSRRCRPFYPHLRCSPAPAGRRPGCSSHPYRHSKTNYPALTWVRQSSRLLGLKYVDAALGEAHDVGLAVAVNVRQKVRVEVLAAPAARLDTPKRTIRH